MATGAYQIGAADGRYRMCVAAKYLREWAIRDGTDRSRQPGRRGRGADPIKWQRGRGKWGIVGADGWNLRCARARRDGVARQRAFNDRDVTD